MTPFRLLTGEEKDLLREVNILNGCGPGDWRGVPEDLLFHADCERHDWDYNVGGTEADRRKADWRFYEGMRFTADVYPWWSAKRYWARIKAWFYYRLVKRWGSDFFTYRDKPFEGTVAELIAAQTSESA